MYSIYVVILLFFSPSDAIARGLGVVGIPLERLFLCFEGCLVYNSPSYIGSGRIPFFFYSFPHSSFFSFFICVSQYEEEKERKKIGLGWIITRQIFISGQRGWRRKLCALQVVAQRARSENYRPIHTHIHLKTYVEDTRTKTSTRTDMSTQ